MNPHNPSAAQGAISAAGATSIRDAAFRPVQTRRTFEEVTAQVREMMFSGSLRPGDRLPPERDLAKLLGVGRPALREALRALEVGGLIDLRKGKTGGAFVSSGNHSVVSVGMSDMMRLGSVTVEELFEAREWILCALVRPACQRITAEELQVLRDNVDVAERLHAQGRHEERITVNFEFYRHLAEATRNPVAVMVVRGLMDALRSLIRKVGTDLAPNFYPLRRELIAAIAARDEGAAAQITARIVKATEQTYKRLADDRREQLGQQPAARPAARKRAPSAKQAASKDKGKTV